MYGRTLVFDLDGTLVNTAPDLHNALNVSLKSAGRDAVSLDKVHHMVGQGARVMLERGLNATGGMVDSDEMDRLFDVFLEYYSNNIANYSRPYEGVLEVLDHCKAQNVTLAVCTNKPEDLARELLEELDMMSYFSAVLGGDSLDVKKPHADHINKTIEAAGGNKDKAIMIGDSAADINAAKNSEIPCIAVSFGYTDIPVHELGPNVIIDHFDELIGAIKSL